MGLEGTLRAFSLGDIFQVLGLQRKSGVLIVENDDDAITISFLGGQIVSADSKRHRQDNQIGKLLLRSGRINESELARALELQKETRQRLGFLLIRERMVTPEDLKEALKLQIFRTLQRAFQWNDGNFRFSQEGQIEYDADHMAPVPTESVLMEAAQIHDELPRLKAKVRSNDLVYRRAPEKEGLTLVSSADAAGEATLPGSRAEQETWKWIDGKRSVAQILETAFLSDFDVLKGLSDLIDRGLIVEGRAPEAVPEVILEEEPLVPEPAVEPVAALAGGVSSGALFLWVAVLALGAFAVWRVPRNTWNFLLRPWAESSPFSVFAKSVSLERLSSIERAVRVHYDATGRYPRSLEELTNSGIIGEAAQRDPWGRPYRYILRPEQAKFGLYGRDARGQIDLDLSFERTLAPVSEIRPGQVQPRPVETQPAVQVVE